MLEDYDDGLDDVDDEDYDYDAANQVQDTEYLYERAYSGDKRAPQPSLPGPMTPPSPGLAPSASVPQLTHLTAPKAGDMVTARYSADGQWYRARVTAVTPLGDGHSLFRVMYEGYGNEEELTLEHVRVPKKAATKAEDELKTLDLKKGIQRKAQVRMPTTTKQSSLRVPQNVTKSRSVPGKLGDKNGSVQKTGKCNDKKNPSKSKNKDKKSPSKSPQTNLPSKKQEAKRKSLLEQRDADTKNNPRVNLVVIGHVDAGKSTLMGHLLVKLKRVDSRTIRRYQKESQQIGKGSFSFAWVLDGHEEERERGITVDVAVTHFSTPNREVTLLDAPGHRDFIPNMISGASQADAAILVVPAKVGEFETSFARGGQTKEHATLIRSLGVKHIILAINKLDLVGWSKDRYLEIENTVVEYLCTLGYKRSQITAVPVSGLKGENLTESKSIDLKHWYKGPTLTGAIDTIPPPSRSGSGNLCMIVTDVFKSQQQGGSITMAGKVETGSIIPKDKLLILPVNVLATVKSITSQGAPLTVARAGDSVEVAVTNLDDDQQLQVGQIVCSPHKPLKYVSEFTAKVLTLSAKIPLLVGQNVVVFSLGSGKPAFIQELVNQIDRKTGEVIRSKPRCVPRESAAELKIRTIQPVCLEPFRDNPSLGRVSIRRANETIAYGIVVSVVRAL